MNIQSNTVKPEISQSQIVNPARLRTAAAPFGPWSAVDSATRRPLNRLVWACLWIILIPVFIPPVAETFSSLRINLLVRLAGSLGALILIPHILLRTWLVNWPLLFLVYAGITTVLNRSGSSEYVGLIESVYPIAANIAIYLMIVASITSRRRFVWFSHYLLIGALINTVFLALGNYGLDSSEIALMGHLGGGLLANENYLAPLLLCGLSAALALLITCKRRWQRIAFTVSVVALYIGAFFTGSRATVGAATFLLGLWGLSISKRRFKFFIMAGLILAFVWSMSDFEPVAYTIDRLIGSGSLESEDRFPLVMAALKLWSENVLFGAGLGAAMETTSHAAHVAFTGLLAETGLIGFAMFYLPVLVLLVKSVRLSRSRDRAKNEKLRLLGPLSVGLAAFLLHGLAEETYFLASFYVQIGLLIVAMRTTKPILQLSKSAVVRKHGKN